MHRLSCLVVIGAVAVAVSVVAAGPALAAKGGNNDNAHACQQGGHESRFEAETGRPFKNAGDCASHGAQGGDTSFVGIDNSGSYPCTNSSLTCWGTLSGSGLKPNTQWFVVLFHGATLTGTVASDGTILAVKPNIICGQRPSAPGEARTSAGQTITSPEVSAPCG